ncbi:MULTISPECIES: efflux RND transporter periplasmic adaptor subunit [unclassified Pseudomonas]|uniref:efflux RND transporter periplasmic adaptor subunit n=1 Tax=unclassified Pseudomonas TaxID=196821 RepID=UPI000BCC239C|nr:MULTISPECIES: efflux RND transporter periplasmic adaptor subunit [unclassified Pseudomonas]PVZ11217.1 RND family efflux transporter MFP subunit [Pseudomonas sp. URIL14HWK12:I12]PVZ22215.1 RND family efflux transporter MFP subunit [Pseudomonas sp. URIL14HWK12:I10]PVZ31661.1 RND family efflux transporter MFP subunit [Pseudomonas sp. URIL14HWK12:I11]SNZ16729.1 RND family efflux transporter, MFP subunit [Pseudomonas sp. URIL14HWK12:I9]
MRTLTRSILACTVLAVLASAALWHNSANESPAGHPVKAVPVKVATVEQADIPRRVSGIGTVHALQSVVIRPQLDGTLMRLWVKEGQFVEKGQLLATLDDRDWRAQLAQAQAGLAQTRAELRAAEADLGRYKALSKDDGISRQQLDQQQAQRDRLAATLLGNQAAVQVATVKLSFTQIHSPLAGRVGIRNVDVGNFLRVSDAQGLFSVTQLDPIAVEFALPQQQLPTLQALLRAPTPAPVLALPSGELAASTPLATGYLQVIDNQVSSSTGTLRAKAEFANPNLALWPGQLVNIQLQTQVYKGALVIPSRVLQRGIDGTFVYRVRNDLAEAVPVKVLDQNSEVIVVEGVAAGDLLISDGQSRVRPGAQVQVIADEPAPDPAALSAQP